MKIEQLQLIAYGPFTDRTLQFDGAGLQVVYGPNEAGKSSALRALTALLYGIEEKTGDSFVHANPALRIGGLLRAREGGELALVRRKGRSRTLLDKEGGELDEGVLAPYLQGVSRELFQTLFGIDHKALVRGGQEILEQKGDVGRALFSAALGSNSLNDVLAELETDAANLFRPRGSTQSINASLRSYNELKKAGSALELSATQWQAHQSALDTADRELKSVELMLAEKQAELSRLERMQRVLPKLARRRQLQEELAQMGEVVALREGFGKHRADAMRERENAQMLIERQTPRLQALQASVANLSINRELLGQSDKVDALHERLGEYRNAVLERPRMQGEYQQLLSDAAAILKTIRPDLALQDIDVLRPILARQKVITEHLQQLPLLTSAAQKADTALREERQRSKQVRKSIEQLPVAEQTDALRREIAAARRHGDLDTGIDKARSELVSLQEQCSDELSRLGRWQGELSRMSTLALPDRAVIDHFDEQYQVQTNRLVKLEDQHDKSAEAVQSLQQQLDEIERVGQVATEAALLTMRSERDTLWHSLRCRWVGDMSTDADADGALLRDDETTLHDAFEHRMAAADEISDRLRREADRVLKLAHVQSRLEAEQRQAQDTALCIKACADGRHKLDESWNALWSGTGISVDLPKLMRAWVERFESLRDRVQLMHRQQQSVDELEQVRARHADLLDAQISALSRSLASTKAIEPVVLFAETLADEHDANRRHREALQQELSRLDIATESLEGEHRLATETLESWKRGWCELLQDLALPADTLPAEMDTLIESIRQVIDKHDEATNRQIAIATLEQDHSLFCKQVDQLIDSLTPELKGTAADDAVSRLSIMLRQSESTQVELKQLQDQVGHTVQEIQQAEGTIAAMNLRLDALCVEVSCVEHPQLESLEKRHSHWLELNAAILGNNNDIIEISDGIDIDELQEQAQAVDPDALPAAIALLQSNIRNELEPRRAAIIETRTRESVELERMNGSNDAALNAENASAVLAGIRADAERYVQVKLAARVLRNQIERYRRDNQGPLVRRASEHFSALTLGAFEALMTDINDKDDPVLAGIRTGGANRVYVQGMSSGTLDQLYLALRLASLEKYMASAEPMPFIVDDVLIEFDDKRSEAALRALAVLAETTQVILFTHHSRVLEQADQIKADIQTHRL